MDIRGLITNYLLMSPGLCTVDGRFLTREEVSACFDSIVRSLRCQYGRGDIVGIRLENDHDYFLSILACMYLGLTYVPLSITWPEERIEV